MPRHLTFANVTSALALIVALASGGAWAATTLPKNSVASEQVKNHSLKAKDFAAGQLPAGPQGPAGPAGPQAATLIAVVNDLSPADAAALAYGRGAVSVSDPAGANTPSDPYIVTFDRDLQGCTAVASPGRVNSTSFIASAAGFSASISGRTVLFASYNAATDNPTDTSFQVAILC